MNVLNLVEEVLRRYPLCDRCLGRLFACLGKGLDNATRGRALKIALAMEIHRRYMEGENVAELIKVLAENGGSPFTELAKSIGIDIGNPKPCYVCLGRIEGLIKEWTERCAEIVKREGLRTFLIGILPPRDIVEREKKIASELGIRFWESVRSELKREIGKRVRDLTGAVPDFDDPQGTIVVDLERGETKLEIPSLLVLGTYWKLGRRISQVPWIRKDGSRKYPLSIEDILQVAAPVARAERAVFHGGGREDVDVRTLGSGRPFVLELHRARERDVDIKLLEEVLNKASPWLAFSLEMKVRREVVAKVKGVTGRGYKIYRALVACSEPVNDDDLKALEEFFRNRVIEQWTPRRVLRRRRNVLRRRKVLEVRTMKIDSNLFEALIKAEGGLYIKELVNCDEGRTNPCISAFLGNRCECIELDVVYVQKQI